MQLVLDGYIVGRDPFFLDKVASEMELGVDLLGTILEQLIVGRSDAPLVCSVDYHLTDRGTSAQTDGRHA